MRYYDGTKLLSMKDINGKTPEIFICTTNRTGGKTTYFGRLLVNKFIQKKEKFALLYRFNYEMDDVSDKFFKDIRGLFFQDYVMTDKRRAQGIYRELFLNDEGCGYAISLNSSDQLKKYSHLFSDVCRILFDEFQSESNHYCNDEIKKLISIHTSIARGQGKQIRYVPVYMIGNPVSILNPYYAELGISERLRSDTKFLKGNGFVLEQGFNDTAAKSQRESSFNQAFSQNAYIGYSVESTYLNDNVSFIEKMFGKSNYIATLKYNGKFYGLREFPENNIIYVDDKPDMSATQKITVTTDDHEKNYVMLQRNSYFIENMRYFFERGCFRFKNLRCKEVIIKALSY